MRCSSILFLALMLGACQGPGATPPPAADSTADSASARVPGSSATSDAPASDASASDDIPAAFRGVWDESSATCDESFSMTRFTVSPNEISWFGGTGDVAAVRGDRDRVEVDLAYIAEGSPTSEPEPHTTTLSLGDAGRLSLGLGGGREGLVRCGEGTDRGYGSHEGNASGTPPAGEGDQTVSLRFAPGATSTTLSDTLRTFALHDYLVRASEGQQITATLRANGPGVPTVIVIRERTYGGPQRDFDTLSPDEQGTTDDGYEWAGAVSEDGVYRVRVAHSGPAANGGAVSRYTLTVAVE